MRLTAAVAFFVLLVLPAAAQNVLAPPGPTLEAVRERGHLVCASADPIPGFAQQDEAGLWSGFDVDFCRAVAAAVFGDAGRVEYRALTGSSRFAHLQAGVIDVLARNGAWTMWRDTAYGVRFVGESFYDGQAVMVPESLGIVSAYELGGQSICVLDVGENVAILEDFFFSLQASYTPVIYEAREDLTVAYTRGLCNAVAAPVSWLQSMRRGLAESSVHRILPERISKDVLGPVVRAGDEQWFKIVRWTLYTLIAAEEAGVSSFNIASLGPARTLAIRRLIGRAGVFGPSIGLEADFMSRIISSVGNYGEIFERNFGPDTGAAMPRGQNALWSNGGLLYAPPIE